MKVEFQKAKLEKVIKKLSPLTKTTVLPIVSNFHFSIKENQAEITATNLNIYGVGKVECESKETIEFLIEAGRFAQAISNCGEKISIDFDKEKRILKLSSGSSKYKFSTEPADDYPVREEIGEDAKTLVIPNIAELVKRSLPAVNKNELRRNMSGVNIGDSIVATDGFRLIKNNIEEKTETPFTIPLEFCEILANTEGDITLKHTEEDLQMEAGDYIYNSKLINDTFPTYQNFIPTKEQLTRSYTINTKELVSAIKSVLINADPITHRILFEFGEKETMKVSTVNAEIAAEAETTLGYEFKSQEGISPLPVTIAFNGKYMLDMLDVIKAEKVELLGTESDRRAFVTEQPDLTYLVMPVGKI